MRRRLTTRAPVNLVSRRERPEAVGPQQRLTRLQRYVTWTERDLKEFAEALAAQRMVDADAWR